MPSTQTPIQLQQQTLLPCVSAAPLPPQVLRFMPSLNLGAPIDLRNSTVRMITPTAPLVKKKRSRKRCFNQNPYNPAKMCGSKTCPGSGNRALCTNTFERDEDCEDFQRTRALKRQAPSSS
jgi:hypothetical protein